MKKIVLKVIIDPNTGQKRINKSFMPYESIEDDFNQIEIIENPPDLIPKAGYAAEYDFDSQGKLYVKYTEIEKTKIEVLEEELQKVKRAIAEGTNVEDINFDELN